MAPRQLSAERLSLETLEEETFYTLLVVRNTPEAKGLVTAAEKLHTAVAAGVQGQKKLTAARLEAEVQVALANRSLDFGVAGFRATLSGKTDNDPEAPLYKRFFGRYRPHEVIRLALASELPIVEPWVDSLKGEADAELKAQGLLLEKLVAAGQAAMAAQRTARQAMADFRSGPRARLFEQVNAGRAALFGELTQLSSDAAWVASFFRVAPASSAPDLESLTVAEAGALRMQRQRELAEAESLEAAAKQREAAAEAAAVVRASQEKELLEGRKAMEALRLRMAELESELKK